MLNLACLRPPGLDVLIFGMHAWLQYAGTRLKNELQPEKTRSYTRPVPGARNGLLQRIHCTMAEYWNTWRRELSELSESQDTLSVESRDVAAKCLALMRMLATGMIKYQIIHMKTRGAEMIWRINYSELHLGSVLCLGLPLILF